MYPFWERVIAPAMDAVQPRKVVEIGALRGETTALMLERLGPECELHVIDPVPQFDPREHERRFPGRYVFHQGISHDVLPRLGPVDVALVDGDHNWFTVHRELHMLADTARDTGTPLPVLVLHDVTWPYGRRDLYYEPSRIPPEHRQPYRRAGMRPGHSDLRFGGMNVDLANAEHEGGPGNGVMTALEDFVAEHDERIRTVVLPVYYGLAIAVEETLLGKMPELEAILDFWESDEGQRELVTLGEQIRLDEAIIAQAWLKSLQERVAQGTDRYLSLLKDALLDVHHLENEVRIDHLARQVGVGGKFDVTPLRDPVRTMRSQYRRLAASRAEGRSLDDERNVAHFPYTDMGRVQLDHLERALDRVEEEGVEGDVAEIGVGRGGGSIFLRGYLSAHGVRNRTVWVADEFRATASEGAEPEDVLEALGTLGADLHQVRDGFDRFDLLDDTVRFLQGRPERRLRQAPIRRLAVARFGPGLGDRLGPALETVHGLLAPGAEVIVDGISDAAARGEVEQVRARLDIAAPLEPIGSDAVRWRHDVDASGEVPQRSDTAAGLRPRRAASRPIDLSVVVVVHDMRREAARTLHSLTRAYQQGVDDLDYEVIVVDNGSPSESALGPAEVRAHGGEFFLLEMGDDATPSPTVALNAGIAAARGRNLALMIDGAHVLSPGVLRHGMLALATYEPAVVATQQWYVGPGQQNEVLHDGYDQAVEDRLFERIHWPSDGYRLFEIGHFIGERDWFDGIIESNCLFAPRDLVEQVGGFDDDFSMPGAGYANLDLFERLIHDPRVNVASILGEGTFHQFHGGTTTNVPDEARHRARVASYGAHFEDLRGRPLLGIDRPVRFVGSLDRPPMKRTRARRHIGAARGAAPDPVASDDVPPVPVPEELELAAIEALWDRGAWREASWLGHPVRRFPTDLHCYQELVVRTRPETVVVAGDDPGLGGRALHVASVLDALGSGRVVAVGEVSPEIVPDHPRIVHVEGTADDEDIARRVRQHAGDGSALVILGLPELPRVVGAFERYVDLVPVDGYVVVENTVMNGRPAEPGHGPGPMEGVFAILARHPDFVVDRAMERYTTTFNRSGYLRRMAP